MLLTQSQGQVIKMLDYLQCGFINELIYFVSTFSQQKILIMIKFIITDVLV